MAIYDSDRLLKRLHLAEGGSSTSSTSSSHPAAAAASLILHLHPTHCRFEHQNGVFLYDSPILPLLDSIRSAQLPVQLLDLLDAIEVEYFEGCLVVQVHDHRAAAAAAADPASAGTTNHPAVNGSTADAGTSSSTINAASTAVSNSHLGKRLASGILKPVAPSSNPSGGGNLSSSQPSSIGLGNSNVPHSPLKPTSSSISANGQALFKTFAATYTQFESARLEAERLRAQEAKRQAQKAAAAAHQQQHAQGLGGKKLPPPPPSSSAAAGNTANGTNNTAHGQSSPSHSTTPLQPSISSSLSQQKNLSRSTDSNKGSSNLQRTTAPTTNSIHSAVAAAVASATAATAGTAIDKDSSSSAVNADGNAKQSLSGDSSVPVYRIVLAPDTETLYADLIALRSEKERERPSLASQSTPSSNTARGVPLPKTSQNHTLPQQEVFLTDEDLLEIEARVLALTAPPLCLCPDPDIGRVANLLADVSAVPISPPYRSKKSLRKVSKVDSSHRDVSSGNNKKHKMITSNGEMETADAAVLANGAEDDKARKDTDGKDVDMQDVAKEETDITPVKMMKKSATKQKADAERLEEQELRKAEQIAREVAELELERTALKAEQERWMMVMDESYGRAFQPSFKRIAFLHDWRNQRTQETARAEALKEQQAAAQRDYRAAQAAAAQASMAKSMARPSSIDQQQQQMQQQQQNARAESVSGDIAVDDVRVPQLGASTLGLSTSGGGLPQQHDASISTAKSQAGTTATTAAPSISTSKKKKNLKASASAAKAASPAPDAPTTAAATSTGGTSLKLTLNSKKSSDAAGASASGTTKKKKDKKSKELQNQQQQEDDIVVNLGSNTSKSATGQIVNAASPPASNNAGSQAGPTIAQQAIMRKTAPLPKAKLKSDVKAQVQAAQQQQQQQATAVNRQSTSPVLPAVSQLPVVRANTSSPSQQSQQLVPPVTQPGMQMPSSSAPPGDGVVPNIGQMTPQQMQQMAQRAFSPMQAGQLQQAQGGQPQNPAAAALQLKAHQAYLQQQASIAAFAQQQQQQQQQPPNQHMQQPNIGIAPANSPFAQHLQMPNQQQPGGHPFTSPQPSQQQPPQPGQAQNPYLNMHRSPVYANATISNSPQPQPHQIPQMTQMQNMQGYYQQPQGPGVPMGPQFTPQQQLQLMAMQQQVQQQQQQQHQQAHNQQQLMQHQQVYQNFANQYPHNMAQPGAPGQSQPQGGAVPQFQQNLLNQLRAAQQMGIQYGSPQQQPQQLQQSQQPPPQQWQQNQQR